MVLMRIHAETRPKLISSFTKRRNDFQFQRRNAKGAFNKAAPLEPLRNRKSKPHRYKKAVRFLYVVPKLRYNTHKGAQQHLLNRRTISATTPWSAFLPPQAARGQSEAANKQVFKGRLALWRLFSTEIAKKHFSFPCGKEKRLLALPRKDRDISK